MEYEEKIKWLQDKANMDGTFTTKNGMYVTYVGKDCVRGELKTESGHSNPIGIVHGGVFATMMDQVSGVAATLVNANGAVKTMDCSIRYLRPGMLSSKIYAQAEVIKAGRKVIFVEAWVEDEQQRHLAEGSFTFCAD